MDKLIKIYIDMLAQANHDIALLKAKNEELYIDCLLYTSPSPRD